MSWLLYWIMVNTLQRKIDWKYDCIVYKPPICPLFLIGKQNNRKFKITMRTIFIMTEKLGINKNLLKYVRDLHFVLSVKFLH